MTTVETLFGDIDVKPTEEEIQEAFEEANPYLDFEAFKAWMIEITGASLEDWENYTDEFEEKFRGEWSDGAAYAEEFVSDCFYDSVKALPGFVVVDWDATWETLRTDFHEIDNGNTVWIFDA